MASVFPLKDDAARGLCGWRPPAPRPYLHLPGHPALPPRPPLGSPRPDPLGTVALGVAGSAMFRSGRCSF